MTASRSIRILLVEDSASDVLLLRDTVDRLPPGEMRLDHADSLATAIHLFADLDDDAVLELMGHLAAFYRSHYAGPQRTPHHEQRVPPETLCHREHPPGHAGHR